MKGVIFIVCLLFLQVVFSLSSSFTTDLDVVELDGSVGQVTWNYDMKQQRESLVYHRQEAKDTLNIRLYDLGVEYLVLEGVCYALPLDKSMPSTSERYSDLSYNKETIKWSNTVDGPVDASLFEIPSSCIKESKISESICEACVALGDKVVNLGCNASSSVIAHVCGASAPICVVILDRLCSGVCEIQQCACDVCIKFTICDECVNGTNTTSTSSSTSTTHTHTTGPASSSSQFSSVASYIKGEDIYDQEGNQEDKIEGGVFCSTCLSVAQEVINLGCNATSSEIANLCGTLFSDVCKQVLETLCSGACSIEDCASQSCCLFDLCDGASCNSTLAVPPSHISTDNGVVKLQL